MNRRRLQDPCHDKFYYTFLQFPDYSHQPNPFKVLSGILLKDVQKLIQDGKLREAAKIVLCLESHGFVFKNNDFDRLKNWDKLQEAISELRPEWDEGFKKIPTRMLYNPKEALDRIRDTIETDGKVKAARMFLRLPSVTQRELSPTPLAVSIPHNQGNVDIIENRNEDPISQIHNEIKELADQRQRNPVLYDAQDLALELCADAAKRSPVLSILKGLFSERTAG